MSHIKNKNSQSELLLRQGLWALKIRGFRLHNKKIKGKPDIFFNKYNLAIFVDGCFWHKCPICFRMPKTNQKFWNNKISGNVGRDMDINKQLTETGLNVLRFWQHDLKNDLEKCINKIVNTIQNEKLRQIT